MTDRAAERGTRITSRVYANAREADQCDLDYWLQMPASERVLQVWKLTLEQWELAGLRNESGLCRSVARVQRR